jgi:fatty acid CoA ligase FadD36
MITDPALASDEIGTPFSHIQWKIMPLHRDGAGHGGLFAVKGPSVMLGYVKAHGGYCGLDEDGYFRSADIVVPTPGGGLRHLGRYDRCFKTGGKLVNPSVVERFLMDQPGVAKAVCIRKAHEILGYVPTVKVVLENGAGNDVEDLKALCMSELEPQMVPSEIAVVADLPQGISGKTLSGVSSSSNP